MSENVHWEDPWDRAGLNEPELSEPERRVLHGGGQGGCAWCEEARGRLIGKGYRPPQLSPRPHSDEKESA